MTYQQLPSELYYFSFSRTKHLLLNESSVIIHYNVLSDLYNSEKLLDDDELEAFRDIHINYEAVFVDVLDLVLKIKDAIYLKCKGYDAEWAIYIARRVEFCTMKIPK